MDTSALRSAYADLLDVAGRPDLGPAADGGWDADHVLAHLLSVDAAVGAVALGVVAGTRPAFDNRVALDPWNLDRIIAGYADRAALVDGVRAQADLLCDIADRLPAAAADVQVPAFLMSGGELVVDRPLPLGALIDGLAADHVPRHRTQLLALSPPT